MRENGRIVYRESQKPEMDKVRAGREKYKETKLDLDQYLQDQEDEQRSKKKSSIVPTIPPASKVDEIMPKRKLLDASQKHLDQRHEQAPRHRDLKVPNTKSSDAPLRRERPNQPSSDQKAQINNHGAEFKMEKQPSSAKIVNVEKVECEKNEQDTSQNLLDLRDEQELNEIADVWPSMSCTGPCNPFLVEERLAWLDSADVKKNEAITSLMDRVTSLEEKLCARENTASEHNRTFTHPYTQSETEILKTEVSRLKTASVEKDKKIAELQQLRSKMTRMNLRLQMNPTSHLDTSTQGESMVKDLQQTIAAKERMINLLKISLQTAGALEDEYIILTPGSSDNEEHNEEHNETQAGQAEEDLACGSVRNTMFRPSQSSGRPSFSK